ncbi:hypothetical protein N8A98_14755 [Devosia neptuniae]|jgi:hypothetical protein|uniref:Uncharacterized protein n=1 Tax=Devosia neptuniae TaxID=191302 RepID=A0ABY6C8R2_9HYPH|nr:hypothetical protein [Devosia neptuniae]UXN68515.1 hypothetical protein N8A98_14755 [Devosia neptuniae]
MPKEARLVRDQLEQALFTLPKDPQAPAIGLLIEEAIEVALEIEFTNSVPPATAAHAKDSPTGELVMPLSYRVVDLASGGAEPPEHQVDGVNSPEAAAEKALGTRLFRSGRKADLRARVYFQRPGMPLSMVRLYAKAIKPD